MPIEGGWYADPASAGHLRWWTGDQWTPHTQPRPLPVWQPVPNVPQAVPLDASQRVGDVYLPPQLIEFGYLPFVCVRHGRRASRLQPAATYSRTPLWVIPLVLVSLLLGLVLALALRVTVFGGWPVCDQCEEIRARRRQAMWAGWAIAALVLVAAISAGSGFLLLLEIPVLIAVLVLHELADWRRVTSATVDRGTRAVHVKAPSRGFVAALPAAPPSPFNLAYQVQNR